MHTNYGFWQLTEHAAQLDDVLLDQQFNDDDNDDADNSW